MRSATWIWTRTGTDSGTSCVALWISTMPGSPPDCSRRAQCRSLHRSVDDHAATRCRFLEDRVSPAGQSREPSSKPPWDGSRKAHQRTHRFPIVWALQRVSSRPRRLAGAFPEIGQPSVDRPWQRQFFSVPPHALSQLLRVSTRQCSRCSADGQAGGVSWNSLPRNKHVLHLSAA
jgi:hypothetical protein